MLNRWIVKLASGCCVCIATVGLDLSTTWAQSSGLTASGTAKSSGPAELMRMKVTIAAKGTTLKDALEALEKKKKSAMIALEKLEAIEDAIHFGEISSGAESNSSQMMQQMQQMLGNDPRIANMMQTKPPVSVSVELTADWSLDSELKAVEQLVACDFLQQKIVKADVASANDDDDLSEEQEELAEEMAAMMQQYGQQQEPAGKPSFHYVRRIQPDVHDKLVREAFENATAKVSRLASAMGVNKGELQSVSESSDVASAMASMYDPYGYTSQASVPTPQTLDDGTIEAVGTSPLSIDHSVTLRVVFAIGP